LRGSKDGGKRIVMDPMPTALVFTGLVLLGFIVFVLVFRWVWNHTLPAVFGVREITFWQAVGILFLATVLTGGHRVVTADITNLPKRLGPSPVMLVPNG
jgi:hypothetical protein